MKQKIKNTIESSTIVRTGGDMGRIFYHVIGRDGNIIGELSEPVGGFGYYRVLINGVEPIQVQWRPEYPYLGNAISDIRAAHADVSELLDVCKHKIALQSQRTK